MLQPYHRALLVLRFMHPKGQPVMAASTWKTAEYREWCLNWPLEKKNHSDNTWKRFIFSLCLKSNGVGTHLFSSKSWAQLRLFSHKRVVWVTAGKWVCTDLYSPQPQVNGLVRKKLCTKQVSQRELRGDLAIPARCPASCICGSMQTFELDTACSSHPQSRRCRPRCVLSYPETEIWSWMRVPAPSFDWKGILDTCN